MRNPFGVLKQGELDMSSKLIYDGKDLLEAIGGMLHQKCPDEEYRKHRCMDIYGKMM